MKLLKVYILNCIIIINKFNKSFRSLFYINITVNLIIVIISERKENHTIVVYKGCAFHVAFKWGEKVHFLRVKEIS